MSRLGYKNILIVLDEIFTVVPDFFIDFIFSYNNNFKKHALCQIETKDSRSIIFVLLYYFTEHAVGLLIAWRVTCDV